MIKRLHFLPWSSYFTERIVNKIRSYNAEDSFIVWKPQGQLQGTQAIYSFQELLSFVNSNCDRHTKFITHSLVLPVAILLGMTKWKNNLSSWITWGAEYNSILKISNWNGCKLKSQNSGLRIKIASIIRVKAIKNINKVLSTPGEIQLLKAALNIQSECIPHHSYFNLEELSNITDPFKENTILIGNSNDISNLHMKAIDWVKAQDYKGNILIPLPDAPVEYITDVAIKLKAYQFNTTLLSKSINSVKFERLISKCSFAIMYHERQQAMLTIYILLWHGTKVFLRTVNPIVQLLKEWGIHFEVIENIENKNCWNMLTDEEINHNKKKINEVLSKEVISAQYQNYLT